MPHHGPYQENCNYIDAFIALSRYCEDAIALLKKEGLDMVPVFDEEEGDMVWLMAKKIMSSGNIGGTPSPDANVIDVWGISMKFKKFKKLSMYA